MKTLADTLGLKGNPFEHYTAETEPNIADYAVRPPYLEAIAGRVRGLSSFILFGDRGAGKSATRLTVYAEIWGDTAPKDARPPLVVNLTDYASILEKLRKDRLEDRDIIRIVAFVVIEQVLAWLSSLEDDDRELYIKGLDEEERTLVLALLKGFYLSVPEIDRNHSTTEALRLLNSAWTTKSAVWMAQRWGALSKIIASALDAFTKSQVDDAADISKAAEELLNSLVGPSPNAPRAALSKLVDFTQAFDFGGVSVLVDKVDETQVTTNSAEATASLVYPLLAHVQLLEVEGFSWILFLWSNVQAHLSGKYAVRLDKIAHANITWTAEHLREMIDARVQFFSSGKLGFADLLKEGLDPDACFCELAGLSMNSPRELIKLMDVIVREHDARGDEAPDRLDQISLDLGRDKYAAETINAWFHPKPLQQVLRLGKEVFVNKDVQTAFKISDQAARVKINQWEDAGLVRQSGTAPSELGAKPANRYILADARVARIIARKLDDVVGKGAEAEEA